MWTRLSLRPGAALRGERLRRLLPAAAVAAVSFAFLACLRPQALFYPPYWDAILGPFHEAVWLAENGFDYLALAREGHGYYQGGPRSYFFSLFPSFLAALMTLIPEPRSFLLAAHLIELAMASASVALFFALAQALLGRRTALLAAPLLLGNPLFLAQSYALGMEIPLLCFALAGVHAYQRGHLVRAGWLLLACFGIKASGIVVSLAVTAAFLVTGFRGRRDARVLALFALPLLLDPLEGLLAARFFLGHEPDVKLRLVDVIGRQLQESTTLFSALLAVLLGFALLPVAWAWPWRRVLRRVLYEHRVLLVSLLVCAQLFAAALLVRTFLPRYLLLGLPFLLLALLWLVRRVAPRLVYALAPAVLLHYAYTLFAEPSGAEARFNNGNQLERTLAYENDLELNRKLARRLEERHRGERIVASWPFVHMLASPAFHYVSQPLDVVSTDARSLAWKGVPHLKDLDLSRRELTDRMLWVWSPNTHAWENRPDTRRDELVERLERGNRRIYLFRRHPDYYASVSQPGFQRWRQVGRDLDPASLERWVRAGAARRAPSP